MPNKPWPSIELVNLKRAIDDVRKLVQETPAGQPDEVSQALSRFLVVRSAGYLEQTVKLTCSAYISSNAPPRVERIAVTYFRRGLNPKPPRLEEVVRVFDAEWEKELTDLLDDDDEKLRREVDYLVKNRNMIAHGQGERITGSKALGLDDSAKLVAEWFVQRFDPR